MTNCLVPGARWSRATIFLRPPLMGLILIRRHLSTAFGMGAVKWVVLSSSQH
jgi:hypothetical protein